MASYPRPMAFALARLGIVGAIVLLIGIVLVGSGFAIEALAEQSEVNCNFSSSSSNNCQQTEQNAVNTSIGAEYVIAGGAMASGIGIFLVLFAMVTIMARREETAPFYPPPPAWTGPIRLARTDIPAPAPPPSSDLPKGP